MWKIHSLYYWHRTPPHLTPKASWETFAKKFLGIFNVTVLYNSPNSCIKTKATLTGSPSSFFAGPQDSKLWLTFIYFAGFILFCKYLILLSKQKKFQTFRLPTTLAFPSDTAATSGKLLRQIKRQLHHLQSRQGKERRLISHEPVGVTKSSHRVLEGGI